MNFDFPRMNRNYTFKSTKDDSVLAVLNNPNTSDLMSTVINFWPDEPTAAFLPPDNEITNPTIHVRITHAETDELLAEGPINDVNVINVLYEPKYRPDIASVVYSRAGIMGDL